MTTILVSQNATPPQWMLEAKNNFVASRNRAQSELAPLHRKTTIISNLSSGLAIGGVVVLAVAALALLIFASSPMIVGYSMLLATVGCCGGMALGIGMMALGTYIPYNRKIQHYYQNEADKLNEIKMYRLGIGFIDRFEKDKELQEAIEPYKESPAPRLVGLLCEKWNEKRRKEIQELKSVFSEVMEGIVNPPTIISFLLSYKEDQKKYIDQIQGADRKEKYRKLLIQLDEKMLKGDWGILPEVW